MMGLKHTESNDLPTKRFLGSYVWDLMKWDVDARACDFNDATGRCKLLNLELDGLHVMDIPCTLATRSTMGVAVRARCAIANFVRRR